MAIFQSIDTVNALSGATASGGIAGGPLQNRSTTAGGKRQTGIDSYTVPASSGPASGDTIYFWPQMITTSRITDLKMELSGFGANVTVSMGKVDPNNSANTDATHYIPATDASIGGITDIASNLGEQVGADPLGDQSTGQTAPGFGDLPIILTATFGGTGTPTASGLITVVFEFVSGT